MRATRRSSATAAAAAVVAAAGGTARRTRRCSRGPDPAPSQRASAAGPAPTNRRRKATGLRSSEGPSPLAGLVYRISGQGSLILAPSSGRTFCRPPPCLGILLPVAGTTWSLGSAPSASSLVGWGLETPRQRLGFDKAQSNPPPEGLPPPSTRPSPGPGPGPSATPLPCPAPALSRRLGRSLSCALHTLPL